MPAVLTWAGGSAPMTSFSYTASVGITPGVGVATFAAVGSAPALAGDLVFGDDTGTLTLRSCHLDRNGYQQVRDRGAWAWRFRFLDRRWKWQIGPAVSGDYNQRDRRNKLVPKTVRSPHQLARLLFAAMGEPVRAVVTGTYHNGTTYTVTVNGVEFEYVSDGTASMGAVASDLASQINASADEAIVDKATAEAVGRILYVDPADADAAVPVVAASATSLPAGGRWYAVPPIDLPAGVARPAAPTLGVPPPGPGDEEVDPAADYYTLGANTPPTGTNPPATWDAVPAALALAQLAESYGRVVVWDPVTDATSLQVEGEGAGLPDAWDGGADLPFVSDAPAVDPRQVPSEIVVAGAPTRFQARLACRAVGREWDGDWRPLSELSYAPYRSEQAMAATVTGTYSPAATYGLTLNGVYFFVPAGTVPNMAGVYAALAAGVSASTDPAIAGKVTAAATDAALTLTGATPGYEFEATADVTGGPANLAWQAICTRGPIPVVPFPLTVTVRLTGSWSPAEGNVYGVGVGEHFFEAAGADFPNMAAVVADLALSIAGSPAAEHVTPSADGDTLVLVGTAAGRPVEVSLVGTSLVSTDEETAAWGVVSENAPLTTTGGRGFERTGTISFQLVTPTERLGYSQAVDLARGSVYKNFQVLASSPGDGTPGIPVPSLDGRVTDRYRLVVLGSRPDQIVPRAGDEHRTDPKTGQPFAAERYDGYAKDREPAAFGSTLHNLGGGYWIPRTGAPYYMGPNTPPRTQFYEPVRLVDPERQVFGFGRPVFRLMGGAVLPPDLVVETGVLVLDEATRAPLRFEHTLAIPGGLGPPRTVIREDVQQEVIGEYDANHEITGFRTLDADAEGRAAYYAREIARTYASSLALTRRYAGLIAVGLSGVARQVSWEMAAGGFFTTASANSEHSTAVVPYPARRFRENLPPDAQQALSNLASGPTAHGLRNAAVRWAGAVRGLFGG